MKEVAAYDAVFLGSGSNQSRGLPIDGMDLDGVLLGLDFLRDRSLNKLTTDFKGKKAVVIGGGNVAVDCARYARRLGAATVAMSCLETRGEMPAHPWELEMAWHEGVFIDCSWGPKRVLGENGKVVGIELRRCTTVFDQEGRFNPKYDDMEMQTLRADIVVMAIGQRSDLSYLGADSGITVTRSGTIQVNGETMQAKGAVFAAGDVVTGHKSVI